MILVQAHMNELTQALMRVGACDWIAICRYLLLNNNLLDCDLYIWIVKVAI
jgi:hypothetical protein